MKRIRIAADVGASLMDRLAADSRFDVRFRNVHGADELIELVRDAKVLVTRHHNRVTAEVIAAAPELELIAQGTSGLDNIDADSARERGIAIIGVPGENANAVAELVMSFMISLTRTVPAYNEMVRAEVWQRDDCMTRRELRAHTLGIVGIGRVGSRVAHLAGAFGVSCVAYDPYLEPDEIRRRGAEPCSTLEELISRSDILTLHVPLNGGTRGMIGGAQLDQLKRGAFVINCCRGPVLDQDALFERLADDRLGGAALDVYREEPPGAVNWPDRSKIILTPHVSGCSRESKDSTGRLVYEAICRHYSLLPAQF